MQLDGLHIFDHDVQVILDCESFEVPGNNGTSACVGRLHICHTHLMAEHDQSATSAAGTFLTLQLCIVIILA